MNTIVNYAVLITSERLLKLRIRTRRIILASLTGALFTPMVFITERSAALSVLIKVVSTAALCAVAFIGGSVRELLKRSLLTLCVSFLYSGAMIAVYQLFRPANMLIVNDVVYFDIHPLTLLALTGIIYGLVCAVERIFRERLRHSVVRLSFRVGDRAFECTGKIDTGCSLTEPFSGDPVIIADGSIFTLPDGAVKRVIPYRTVAASSLLFAVHADAVSIGGREVGRSVYIAQGSVHNSAYQAIIHSDIVR